MTRYRHRRTITGAPRLIVSEPVAVAALAVAAASSSAATGAQFDGDTLQIFGDGGEQTLAIVNQPSSYVLDIGKNGTADFTFDRDAFTELTVDARGGDDRFDSSTAAAPSTRRSPPTAAPATTRCAAADGPETLLGGSGNDLVDGNIGADTVAARPRQRPLRVGAGRRHRRGRGAAGSDALDFNGSNTPEDIHYHGQRRHARPTPATSLSVTMDFDGHRARA